MLDLALPGPEKFIWPTFLREGLDGKEPIESMPGQHRLGLDGLLRETEGIVNAGIGGILLFGLGEASDKDNHGVGAYAEDGIVQRAVGELRREFPDLTIATDVCLCAYTDHGHCGPLSAEGEVENDAANDELAKVAVSHAAAGADIVAPSAMMDGQVMAIRDALDDNGFEQTILMSYSTKFASSMYGPFREAEQSSPQKGDRKGYQASYGDLRQALRESEFDVDEGADILMVKPSLFYLDVLSCLADECDLPIAAYNVSGEYSMMIATAERGWGELAPMVRESTTALVRAGANIIISYWANRYKEIFTDG
jgi:porphobilinogen synthase